jgi:hypothetical protein
MRGWAHFTPDRFTAGMARRPMSGRRLAWLAVTVMAGEGQPCVRRLRSKSVAVLPVPETGSGPFMGRGGVAFGPIGCREVACWVGSHGGLPHDDALVLRLCRGCGEVPGTAGSGALVPRYAIVG